MGKSLEGSAYKFPKTLVILLCRKFGSVVFTALRYSDNRGVGFFNNPDESKRTSLSTFSLLVIEKSMAI